jgi:hypothetical protein
VTFLFVAGNGTLSGIVNPMRMIEPLAWWLRPLEPSGSSEKKTLRSEE